MLNFWVFGIIWYWIYNLYIELIFDIGGDM